MDPRNMHISYASEYQRLSNKGRFPAEENIFGRFGQKPGTDSAARQVTDFYEWMNSALFSTSKEAVSPCVLCGENVRDLASHIEHGPIHGEKWRKCLLMNGTLAAQDTLALIYFLIFKGEQTGPDISGDEFLAFCGIMQKYPTIEHFVPGPDYPLDIKLICAFSKRVYAWANGSPS